MEKHERTFRCPITLNNKAKEKLRELGIEESSFFRLENSFRVYLEKYPLSADRVLEIAIFFDNVMNVNLADKFNGLVIVMHCVVKPERLVVRNVTARAAHTTLQSNWRMPLDLSVDERGERVPLDLLNLIHNMPVLQESSMYVKKRIASWEGYLKIQEQSADISDMITNYSRLIYNGDFSRVTITGCKLKDAEWRSLKGLSVKLKGIDQDIGKVLKANPSASSVEVELHGYMEEKARSGRLDVHPKEVIFSNFATLSQLKRLRQGFKQLENGLAANPELERLLFENKPPVKEVKHRAKLQFHNRLNEFQQEAVIGAMSAEDLYVIQGPPGTGKTTVISEICLQNAKAGLRTLVASQSNLAVDNALGRLLANKDIRILRMGRTESIEEEGKKFIEENVGQYWKDHTFQEVSTQFEARKRRETELEAEWITNEEEEERFQLQLARITNELEAKRIAQQQYNELEAAINKISNDVKQAEREQQKTLQQLRETEQSLLKLNELLEKDEEFLATEPDGSVIHTEWDNIQKEIRRLKDSIALQELEIELNLKKQNIEQASEESNKWEEAVQQAETLLARIQAAPKVDSLKWMILEQNINRSFQVQQLIEKLDGLRDEIIQHEKLKDYNEKLTRAISYLEQLLEKQSISIGQQRDRLLKLAPIPTNAEGIDQFLEKLRLELKGRTFIDSEFLIISLEELYKRRNFIWKRVKKLQPYSKCKNMTLEAFGQLKQELFEQVQIVKQDKSLLQQKWLRVMDEQNGELTILQEKHKQMGTATEIVPNASALLEEKEGESLELQKRIEVIEQATIRVKMNLENRAVKELELQELEQKRIQDEEYLLTEKSLLLEKQNNLVPLQKILSTEPEREHEEVLKNLASISFKRESLKQEKLRLPLFQSVQGMWLSLLEEANEHDLDEIRKLYVKHANVIGTTCVASARKDFIESYPVFDVVIIDEVSKATPPELLLPMLKGKKIILVGDHHQLPPLLGDDTLEETLQKLAEESDDFDGKTELRNLLKESLFERLFKNLPKTHKKMLAIQYRMHENIMSTITQFYQQEEEGLQCGLTDSDFERDHLLETSLIQRNHHLVWLDMPNEPAFFEERMKEGRSLFNPAELKQIGDLLKELDEAAAEAKLAGRMAADEKKSIGVISFYGEQVKRIDRMLQQELRLSNLTIRTGTVDRFQGMEMDVILLSMVRNHDNKHDDIGFAKDYRRLNVALSRARELLVLIGSTKMFTEVTKQKETRRMYNNVLEAVKKQQGLRMLEEVGML